MERTTQYKRDLQVQLVNRQRERQCVYEDSLVEKKMLEEIMRTIADEDQRELQQKRMLKERTCREMATSQRARAAWKDKQKEMVIKEERELQEQRKAAADRSSAIVAERERKMREKDELCERISAKIMADELLKQIADNDEKRKKEHALEEARAQNVWDCDKAWRAEIEEERRKIMTEHAPPLVGYLQAGVLQPRDLRAVREGAAQHPCLAQLDIDSMAVSNRPHRFSKCNAQCNILRDY
ncbi:putative Myosin heavy chain, cardiac muscle alpha isoform [Operophtera brumata]|uniref:Meiosis-specific nuclear structural protein 1 n=1 Tax=Operophtera brumata TaxID=104452 RepID=A0A0L7L053_OPEBR|nr:putative Myosin heavy chain, cardiac muscle alpha isoform [Operophtera brumata]